MSQPDRETLTRRIKNLLKLGACKTAPEAASAAAMAQSLMEKYRIKVTLEEATGAAPKVEKPRPVERTIYRFEGRKLATWICDLVDGLGKANGCYTWSRRSAVALPEMRGAGQPEDLDAVAYMVSYLVLEIERLCAGGLKNRSFDARQAQSHGRTWANSFRNGAAEEVCRRVREAKRAAWEAAKDPVKAREDAYLDAMKTGDAEALLELDRAPAPAAATFAIARVVENALAKQIEDLAALEKEKQKEHGLTTRRVTYNLSGDGYAAGKRAGAGIALGRNHRQIGGGR